MKNRTLCQWIGILAMVGSLQAGAMVSTETKHLADTIGASSLTEVKFDTQASSLSEPEKKELASLVNDARAKGEIKEVRVLVWADKEYPMPNQAVAKSDVDLAQRRSKEIANYLKEQLGVSKVRTFNMAERPNKFEKFFKTPDAKMKEATTAAGAAPSTSTETGLLGLKGQASKAVAFIFMK